MRSIKLLVASALLALFCAGVALAQAPEFQPREEWLGIYFRKSKIGYEHIVLRKDVLDGKPVYRRDEYTRIRVNFNVDIRFTLFCDEQYKPIVTDWEIDQPGGAKETGEWTYGDKTVMMFSKSSDKTMQNQVIGLPGTAGNLSESCRFAMGTWPVQEKDLLFQCTGYLRLSMLDGLDMNPIHLMIVGDKKEKITVSGKDYDCFVIDHQQLYQTEDGQIGATSAGYKSWVLEDGTLVKEANDDLIDPEDWIKTTREDAMEGIGDVGQAESPYASGEINSSKYIPDSHDVVELHVRVPNLDPDYTVADDDCQTETYDKGTRTADIHTKYIPVDEDKAPQIPVKGSEFSKWLADVPGLQVHADDIQKLAHSIIGNETNSWRASLKLRRWVMENMPYSMDATTEHDAETVKDLLIGCCRHYAILYCCLARAVGIPTKMCSGVGYVGSGFGGHAWCESWFGHWVVVDATWNLDQASAVYVKLSEFEKPRYYGYGFYASNLIEVVDYKKMPRKAPTMFDNKPRTVPDLPKDPASLLHEEWRSIYLGETKIGYIHSAVRKATMSGFPVYRKDEEVKLRMKSTSQPGTAAIDYQWTMFADNKFNPMWAVGRSTTKENGTFFRPPVKENQQFESDKDYVFELDYNPVGCLESRWENGVKTDECTQWPVPPADTLPNSVAYDFGLKKFKVGEEFPAGHIRIRDFIVYSGQIIVDNESCPQTADNYWDSLAKVKVLKKEKVTLNGKTYDTTVVQDTGQLPEIIKRWYLDDGTILKSEHQFGVHQIKVSREEAMKGLEGDGPDVSAVAVDDKVPEPEKVVQSTIKLSGAWHGELAVNLRGQTVKRDKKKNEMMYTVIVKPKFDDKKAMTLPIQDSEATQWLTHEGPVNMSDPDIVAQAKDIAGDETNSYKVACLLRKWVHDNIQLNDASKTEPESVAILKAKEGDRSERTILFITLARALGLPARFIGGIRYADGKYHWDIWAEVYVGEWIQMDPSASVDYVDACHLKFSNGEYLDVKGLGKVGIMLGSVKAEIMNYKTIDGKTVSLHKVEKPKPEKKPTVKAKSNAKTKNTKEDW